MCRVPHGSSNSVAAWLGVTAGYAGPTQRRQALVDGLRLAQPLAARARRLEPLAAGQVDQVERACNECMTGAVSCRWASCVRRQGSGGRHQATTTSGAPG